jgi:hypothetical protein
MGVAKLEHRLNARRYAVPDFEPDAVQNEIPASVPVYVLMMPVRRPEDTNNDKSGKCVTTNEKLRRQGKHRWAANP